VLDIAHRSAFPLCNQHAPQAVFCEVLEIMTDTFAKPRASRTSKRGSPPAMNLSWRWSGAPRTHS
jgi:hypothetical protein